MAMPDGRMLSEKVVLRSRKIRVQDFHTNSCEKHIHTGHCGVRRISYTGLGEIMQNIAWELDVLRVIAENNFGEEDKPKKCACAVRLSLDLRQPVRNIFTPVTAVLEESVTLGLAKLCRISLGSLMFFE